MANKIVILTKHEASGVEYPLDADNGTNLRGLCRDSNNGFWVMIQTITSPGNSFVRRYRIDAAGLAARRLGDEITIGNSTGAFGVARAGDRIYASYHGLRAGTHTNNILEFRSSYSGLFQTGSLTIDSGAADNGNRFLGLDWETAKLIAIYNSSVANSNRRAYRNYPDTNLAENISTGLTNVTDICAEGDGTYWTIGSDNVIRRFRQNGTEITDEAVTLTHSGTARGICQAGLGRLAVSMT